MYLAEEIGESVSILSSQKQKSTILLLMIDVYLEAYLKSNGLYRQTFFNMYRKLEDSEK